MNYQEILAWFEANGTQRYADGLSRFGIVTKLRVHGVSMAQLNQLQKKVGKDHALAEELWNSGCYEGRLFAALVGEPAKLTKKQMNSWAASFENWADCDTACFRLFDQSPLAWEQAVKWSASPREFVKRGGFALMASLALHQKKADDALFLPFLPLIEKEAVDDRNFVKKGVNWALRGIGKRKGLRTAATEVAKRLAGSDVASCRWVGKDALREFAKAKK